MAQTGYTPILTYASGTPGNTPSASNLTSSASGAELAINYADGKLFYKDSGGTVQVLAVKMPSGILPIANGGTNATAVPTAGAVAYGTGTAYAFTSAGTSNQVLISNGSSAPSWANLSSLGVTSLSFGTTGLTPSTATQGAITVAGTLATTNGGTGLTSFTANGVVYASSTSALTTGSALTFDGSGLFGVGTNATPSHGVKGIVTANSANASALQLTNNVGSGSVGGSLLYANSGDDFQLYTFTGAIGSETYSLRYQITSGGAAHVWKNGASESMRLTSTGLLVKTSTTPSGSAALTLNSGNGVQFAATGGGGNITPTNNGGLQFFTYTGAIGSESYTERMRLDSSGNLGLGVTPSAWSGFGGKSLQLAYGALFSDSPSTIGLSGNAYYNGGWKYFGTGNASIYQTASGAHYWFTAPSGTAGNAISFTQAMTLDASGRLLLGMTSGANSRLNVQQDSGGVNITLFNNTNDAYTYLTNNGSEFRIQNSYNVSAGYKPITFYANGSENARIDSSGNLLVGTTTSSGANVTVYGSSEARTIYQNSTTGTGSGHGLYVGISGADALLYNYANGALVLATNNTERARIDSSGNVGIGTTTTGARLTVFTSNANNTDGLLVRGGATTSNVMIRPAMSAGANNGIVQAGDSGIIFDKNAENTGAFVIAPWASTTCGIRMDNAGNVGIGTSSPGYRLDVAAADTTAGIGYAARIRANATAGAGALQFTDSAVSTQYGLISFGVNGVGLIQADGASSRIAFQTNGSERARIDSSGNLLVGTTDSGPTSGTGIKLRPGGGGANLPRVDIVTTGSTGATSSYSLYSTGAGAFRFYVQDSGQINATSTSIAAISDITLKENVRDLETGLSEVMALKPRRFDWKNGDGKDVAGFIAQELEEVLPDLVYDYQYTAGETKKSIKMGDILPTLVKAIQDQQTIINQLKARLDAANL